MLPNKRVFARLILTLWNFEFTVFLAQIGMVSGPKLIPTVQQPGRLFLGLGAAIILAPVLFAMLVGHFVLKLRFDDLRGASAGGAPRNPSILAFATKPMTTDRANIAYANTFPTAVMLKIIYVQAMLTIESNLPPPRYYFGLAVEVSKH